MIFLKKNVLLEQDLTPEDIKPRLLGHWGTCPGLSMIYAHLNRVISKTDIDALYVVGPGTAFDKPFPSTSLSHPIERTWCTSDTCLPLAGRLSEQI